MIRVPVGVLHGVTCNDAMFAEPMMEKPYVMIRLRGSIESSLRVLRPASKSG